MKSSHEGSSAPVILLQIRISVAEIFQILLLEPCGLSEKSKTPKVLCSVIAN